MRWIKNWKNVSNSLRNAYLKYINKIGFHGEGPRSISFKLPFLTSEPGSSGGFLLVTYYFSSRRMHIRTRRTVNIYSNVHGLRYTFSADCVAPEKMSRGRRKREKNLCWRRTRDEFSYSRVSLLPSPLLPPSPGHLLSVALRSKRGY